MERLMGRVEGSDDGLERFLLLGKIENLAFQLRFGFGLCADRGLDGFFLGVQRSQGLAMRLFLLSKRLQSTGKLIRIVGIVMIHIFTLIFTFWIHLTLIGLLLHQ